MKTFRCVFHIGKETKTIDVAASDAMTAARRAASQSPTLSFQRVELEDEQGHLFVTTARSGSPAKGRVRVFPLETAA